MNRRANRRCGHLQGARGVDCFAVPRALCKYVHVVVDEVDTHTYK